MEADSCYSPSEVVTLYGKWAEWYHLDKDDKGNIYEFNNKFFDRGEKQLECLLDEHQRREVEKPICPFGSIPEWMGNKKDG
ncbi:MAG: hypothetical protein OXE94_06285 [Aestuariivita sp.]|nr:hypothetical protein [Aestuariivita sp.]MCY4203980.1 hypothetical protein [Aestuariivita sp.]